MSMIKSYAAKEAGGELELYEYDPGELKPQDVEVQVDYSPRRIKVCRSVSVSGLAGRRVAVVTATPVLAVIRSTASKVRCRRL